MHLLEFIWAIYIRVMGCSICEILWQRWLWKGFGMKDGNMCINLFFPFVRRFKETSLKAMPARAVWVGLKTDFICHGALESSSVLSTPLLFLKIKCILGNILGNVYGAEDSIHRKNRRMKHWNYYYCKALSWNFKVFGSVFLYQDICFSDLPWTLVFTGVNVHIS